MKHKRKLLARLMHYTGLSELSLRFVPLLAPGLRILAYHRVYTIQNESTFEPDIGLISVSVAEFEWQMSLVKKYFTPITFVDLFDFIRKGEAVPLNAIIVSFDDGYADNYYNAFQILKSFDIPATIFLATGFIDSGLPFWYDWVSIILSKTTKKRLVLNQIGLDLPLEGTAELRHKSCEILLAKLKRVPNEIRICVLNELPQILGVDSNVELDKYSKPLDWSQIKEMNEAGIQFGGHSVTHPILTSLDSQQLEDEVVGCFKRIKNKLSKDPIVFSYPVGGKQDINESVKDQVRAAGFKMAVSYIDGYNKPKMFDEYQMRRIHVERDLSRSDFSALLAFPGVFST